MHKKVILPISFLLLSSFLIFQGWHFFKEIASNHNTYIIVLIMGLFLTGLFGFFKSIKAIDGKESQRNLTNIDTYLIPIIIFIFFASGSIFLHHFQTKLELKQAHKLVENQTSNIESSINAYLKEKLNALIRKAERWNVAEGTPYNVWQYDSQNYINYFSAFRTIEWVDRNYNIQWIEPLEGNEEAVGLNIISDEISKDMLQEAAQKNTPAVTPPLKSVQGHEAFVTYIPVKANGEFDGFMVGVVDIDKFFEIMLQNETAKNYTISALYNGKEYFNSDLDGFGSTTGFEVERNLKIYDKSWILRISPKQQLINDQKTLLPAAFLIAGLIISGLLALAIRYLLIAEIQSNRLLESEQFSNTVIENIPDILFVKDENFRIIKANSKFLSLNPEPLRDSIIGTTLIEKFSKPEADAFLQKDKEAFRDGVSDYEEEILFPNGQKHILNTIKTRFYNTQNEAFILCIGRDISERKEYDSERDSLTQKLLESNTELERFAYVASHDMQEPLRMISSFSEIISDDYADKLDDAGKEYLQVIRDSSERMSAMIMDLLQYAQLEHNELSLSKVDANKELKHALDNLRQLLEDKKAKITHENLPIIRGNPIQFMRLLQNLIANGIKYQPAENIPEIHIGAEEKETEWHFTVRDNGLGVHEKFIQDIFLPFRRLQGWSDVKGSGVGLAICKKIVENHGGQIWVTSEEGKGSTFHFTVPKDISHN